ncbi:MAG: hypothetical protein OXG56_03825 [Gammaproteobacteria bacterium]|nr:hypothetical protein [Gammaproteobacteria bacterium]
MQNNESSLLPEQSDKSLEQIQELQKHLEKEKDARKEERFIWILVSTILLNICFFTAMQSMLGPLVIVFLQIIAFALVAKKMGMGEVVQLINRMVSTIAKTAK